MILQTNAPGTGGGSGSDTNAIHNNVDNEITAITEEAIALDDVIMYERSEDGAKRSSTLGDAFTEQILTITSANETDFPTFTGIPGQEGYYNNKYYRCVATNTWVRWAVETA